MYVKYVLTLSGDTIILRVLFIVFIYLLFFLIQETENSSRENLVK